MQESNLIKSIEGINWKDLREQKEWLLNDNNIMDSNAQALVNLIDSLQDATVSDGLFSCNAVFGFNELTSLPESF